MNIKGYLDYINAPWGKLFYRLVWNELNFSYKSILDFGSGFGVTADHLAKNNDVVAVEPDEEMLTNRVCENYYKQLAGGIDVISKLPDDSFDVIICHNVFEYLDDRRELLTEFSRLLRPGGQLSVVKHNKAGKIMHKAVFECNAAEAIALLNGGTADSVNFGVIREYELSDLENYCQGLFEISSVHGIRAFYGLQANSVKNCDTWLDDMYKLETAVNDIPQFRDIAFFQHVMLYKVEL